MDDEESFEIFMDRYLVSVYSFVRTRTRDVALAEDITQETFLKAWKYRNRLDTTRDPKIWLFTIARNTLIDYFRKKKIPTLGVVMGDDVEELIADDALLPDEQLSIEEDHVRIEEALALLSDTQREILMLHLDESLTFEEIKGILKKPLNTVKSTYRRALLRLRELLNAPK